MQSPASSRARDLVSTPGVVGASTAGVLFVAVSLVSAGALGLGPGLGHRQWFVVMLSASVLVALVTLTAVTRMLAKLRSERVRSDELIGRLSNAVNQTADAVFITDRAGAIEYVNPAFERTSGYSRGEVVGKTPRILKSGVQGPEYYAKLWQTVLGGEPFHGTSVNRKRNGDLYYAEQTITPMKAGDGEITHFVSVMRDMTDRRKIREQEIELRLAASIQRRLLPPPMARSDGYEIAGAVLPALAVCGDYYDTISTSDGRLCLAVGDASGHGVGPALIAVQTRTHLRSLLQTELELDEILREINRILCSDLDDGLFITLAVARLHPATGSLEWASAGHPTAYVFDGGGNLRSELGSTGLPLGMLADRPHTTNRGVTLEPGDSLLMVSDGFLETENPEGCEFGSRRLLDAVRASAGVPAAEVVQRLQDALRLFADGQPQSDDLTAVVCRRAPSG